MNPSKIIGAVLIVCGILGLAYGGFSYTKDTQKASIGPINLSVQETERVNVPLWASLVAIAAGAAVLMIGAKKG
jgi:hypothetical protein